MTFLLTWNPNKFHWTEYGYLCHYASFPTCSYWSTCSRKMQTGDDFYLLMQGMREQNGIVGYGKFVTRDKKWNWTDNPAQPLVFRTAGNRTKFVDIRFDRLVDYRTDEYVHTSMLEYLFSEQCWRPQSSGILVKEEIAEVLANLPELKSHNPFTG